MHQEEIDCYSRLFRAIIIQAVQDGGAKPTKEERLAQTNWRSEAVSAMEYLFGCNRHVFARHAALIGADAEQLRESLLNRMQPLTVCNSEVTADTLRMFRIRYRWHQRRNHV